MNLRRGASRRKDCLRRLEIGTCPQKPGEPAHGSTAAVRATPMIASALMPRLPF